mmetsp:Transcript_23238/g.34236  ORF Transcript_23238/g.34236 Transcript_23238/m.34236 type:complete len:97 (+) Transcript_23238:1239-1529(+)
MFFPNVPQCSPYSILKPLLFYLPFFLVRLSELQLLFSTQSQVTEFHFSLCIFELLTAMFNDLSGITSFWRFLGFIPESFFFLCSSDVISFTVAAIR